MKKYLTLSLSALIFTALPTTVQYAQATESHQQQKASDVWIDVRSAEEYQQGHLQDALNISHSEIVAGVSRLNLAKDAPINLYCRSGRRAEVAMVELKKLGYSNVTNHGGYDDLIKQGLK